ncbi:hypothetical protein TWF481_005711 [Arthrobotrys musiformis]|uniref:Aminoglycoside phosphotransferase domain-containing protein n=1 Tax=Arthrobotrys musiformis TaxID=47236 RepID=A0AAV9WEP7_9PEZI
MEDHISQFAPIPSSFEAQTAHHITKFFETNEITTQQECDEHAAVIAERSVSPTTLQGQKSYTVVAADESMLVQFRPPNCPLDVASFEAARAIYGRRFVPACVFRESWRGLFVYVMDFIQSDALAIARRVLFVKTNKHILSSTLSDLSAFFAISYTNRSDSTTTDIKRLYHTYDSRLAALNDTLPPKLYSKLNTARNQLWRIFDPSHPIVLNHAGLTDTNIHIDTETGRITGIIDWSDSSSGPFGISIWGVDIVLAIPSGDKWHWHPDHVALRRQFWETLSSSILLTNEEVATVKIARVVGLFLAFGYCKGVLVEDDTRMMYLDAMLGVE